MCVAILSILGGQDPVRNLLNLTFLLPPFPRQYDVIVGGQAGEERAFVRVVVRVRDVNDLPPRFFRPLFETQITEEDDRHLPKSILQVRLRILLEEL